MDVNTVNTNTGNMADQVVSFYTHETDTVDFSVGSFVTQCNPAAEITSLISPLYISDKHSDDGDNCVAYMSSMAVVQTLQTEVKQCKVALKWISNRKG